MLKKQSQNNFKQLVKDRLNKMTEEEFKTKYEEVENLVNKYDLNNIFQITNITDASTFLNERNKLNSELYQLYRNCGNNEELKSKTINLALKYYSRYIDFNPFDVDIPYFASIFNSNKKSTVNAIQSYWKENVDLQDLTKKLDALNNEILINQELVKISKETKTLTYNIPIENMYNFLLDFSQIIPDPQLSKISGPSEDEYTLKTQMGNLTFKIIEKELNKKLIYQYNFLEGTWGEKGVFHITFSQPQPGSVELNIRNEIQEISKNNVENLNVNNILGNFLKTYLDFNLGKIVAKQVQTILYEKTFDDLTMGNYRILQTKLNALGKDINNLKAKYFEVKAPITLNSFECSECGATLNISSKEEKFLICDHCDTPFLIEWQDKK